MSLSCIVRAGACDQRICSLRRKGAWIEPANQETSKQEVMVVRTDAGLVSRVQKPRLFIALRAGGIKTLDVFC